MDNPTPTRSTGRPVRLDSKTADLLLRVYLERRVQYQLRYYRTKMQEYGQNSDSIFRFNALIMAATSFLAAIGTQGDIPGWVRLLTAILPAIAAGAGSLRELYQWDRQIALYRDTTLGLERSLLGVPDAEVRAVDDALAVYPKLVVSAEQVFSDEVSQWGQIAMGPDEDEEDEEAFLERFAKRYNLDIYDENGDIDPDKVEQFRGILDVARGRQGAPQMAGGRELPALAEGIAGDGEAAAQATAAMVAGADLVNQITGGELDDAIDAAMGAYETGSHDALEVDEAPAEGDALDVGAQAATDADMAGGFVDTATDDADDPMGTEASGGGKAGSGGGFAEAAAPIADDVIDADMGTSGGATIEAEMPVVDAASVDEMSSGKGDSGGGFIAADAPAADESTEPEYIGDSGYGSGTGKGGSGGAIEGDDALDDETGTFDDATTSFIADAVDMDAHFDDKVQTAEMDIPGMTSRAPADDADAAGDVTDDLDEMENSDWPNDEDPVP